MTKKHVLLTSAIVAPPQKRNVAIVWLPLAGFLFVVTMIDLPIDGMALDGLAYSPVQRDWFLALNSRAQTLPTGVWQTLTILGNGAVLLLLLSPLLWCYPKVWWSTLASAPFAGALSVLGKQWAAVPRPAAVLDPTAFTIIGDPLMGANSFPSGHSITIFAGVTAVLITLRLQSRSRQLLLVTGGLVLAMAVSFSRIAVGAHWPLDLLAGAFVGCVSALLGVALVRFVANRTIRISNRTGEA